jgi:hypothetical protein
MHIAIGHIDRRAKALAPRPQIDPFGTTENLVDQHGSGDAPQARARQAMLEGAARIG